MHPLLAETVVRGHEGAAGSRVLEPALSESLRQNLVSSSVQELDRRGFREVKVLPREAVNRLVAEAAAKLIGERMERAIAAERARIEAAARAEALFFTEQIEQARVDRAAAERRAEAARLERQAALEEADAARRGRTEALRQAAEAEEAFGGARRAVAAAEAALARARADFEAQLGAVLADPLAFAAHKRGRPARGGRDLGREIARRRATGAVKRMAAELRGLRAMAERAERAGEASSGVSAVAAAKSESTEPTRPARPAPLELVLRRSIGFGLAPRIEPAGVEPRAQPAPPPAAAAERSADGAAGGALRGADLSRLDSRLAAIERKLDLALEGLAALETGRASPGEGGAGHEGVPSKFGPGVPAGLRKDDPRYQEKHAILRKLLEDNVTLRREIEGSGGIGGT